MKKKVTFISCFLAFFVSYGQVGINTTSPQLTLDVVSKLGPTDKDGFTAPRLTRAQLTAKGNTLYGIGQNGAIIFITDITGGNTNNQRVNITETGYYYFDSASNIWQKMPSKNEVTALEPWQIANSSLKATRNNESIYQNAQIGIGDFSSDSPTSDLDVKGSSFIRTNSGIGNHLYFNSAVTSTPDVLIKRAAANNLQIESVLTTRNNGSGGTVNIQSYDAVADAFPSFAINKDGVIVLGNGDVPVDVRLSRGGPNLLRSQNTALAISRIGPTDITPAFRVSTNDLNSILNPNPMFEVMVSGKLRWGAGTTNVPDLNLERDGITSKLKLTGTAYSGSAGNRYLLIDPSTGLISMSSGSATSVARSMSNGVSDSVIQDLQDQITKQNEKINRLEILINNLSINSTK